ncbi:hypothetical protein GCM10007874_14400 [Labrys miyagiensis]|uniref:Uncharacterized protein n=1 Tax=Labrys miyagiensis TaxID=346912 RepID=A0ABQ6CDI9_9HYPH|nr:hypothetical protein GCM10007874_14400 [Labrys miyagiensis]
MALGQHRAAGLGEDIAEQHGLDPDAEAMALRHSLEAAMAEIGPGAKAFCDLTDSARIAKTRRNKEPEQSSAYA